MTFTEQEVHDIVEMVVSGMNIETAKEKIIGNYRSSYIDISTKIARAVMKHFNISSLSPLSRSTADIIPMQVYAFLLNDLIKGSLPNDVKKDFTSNTKRERLTLYHYTKMYRNQSHLVDYRYAYRDTVTNHFLSIKEKITGEKLDKYRIEAHSYDEDKGLTIMQIKYRDNEKRIIQDIEDLTSYHELNNKYFQYRTISAFKKMFDKTYPMYIGKIRYGNTVVINKFINKNKKTFLDRVNNGATFKSLNNEFKLYSRVSDLKRFMLRYEPIIAKMILENEG